jgi:hypothetical protein
LRDDPADERDPRRPDLVLPFLLLWLRLLRHGITLSAALERGGNSCAANCSQQDARFGRGAFRAATPTSGRGRSTAVRPRSLGKALALRLHE